MCVCVCVCARGVLCSGVWCVLKGLFGKLFVMEQGSLGNLFVLVIRGVAYGCAAYCSGDPLSNPRFTLLPLIRFCCFAVQLPCPGRRQRYNSTIHNGNTSLRKNEMATHIHTDIETMKSKCF